MNDKMLANVLPHGIISLNKDKQFQWWNKTAYDLLSIEDTSTLETLFPMLEGGLIDELLETPIEIQLSNPEKTRLSLSLISYADTGYLLLIEDVTHVYHLEKMRQDFLANVSHELRTPLTVVHGYLETLLDEPMSMDPPWSRIFEQMYQQSHRMENLVNDLLLLSQLEADLPENQTCQTVSIPNLLKTIVQEAKSLSGEANHQFHLNLDETLNIEGVEEELRSAFSNIIFNAVKYTPPEGEITVSWKIKDKHPSLIVKDTGFGIAEKHLSRLTERFYRVDKHRSRKSGGTGLGLAIVKHVLIRHKAELKIASQLGKGSVFTCSFSEQKG